tara:strand:+ start:420 stop:773 length:354 start_codon:yes stop_codon:yes gene_type:complete
MLSINDPYTSATSSQKSDAKKFIKKKLKLRIKTNKIMENPKIKVKIKHSESKHAWNIIGTMAGAKYKIARIPYCQEDKEGWEIYNTRQKSEALNQAEWIVFCFNASDKIIASGITNK